MNPKHKKAYYFFNKGLFINLNSFIELENRIFELPDYERGDAFEIFAEAYFKTQIIHQVQEIWPESELPENIRHKLKLPPIDMGIDGVFQTHNGEHHAYQVKYRTNRLNLLWDELSTFMGLSDKSDKRVLFTNSNDISYVMNDRSNFYSVKGNDLDKLDQSDFQAIENWLKSGSIVRQKKSPLPHQTDAIDDILQELNVKNRATAIMACGTGKTLVGLWVVEKINAQTVLVLLPSLALVKQTLHDWAKQNSWNTFNYLCVCSDTTVINSEDKTIFKQYDLDFLVTTQKEAVEQFLNNQTIAQKIIFSTYQSSKIVAEAMPQGFSFDLALFDEAHKTASRKEANFAFALQDRNVSIKKRLFLTATPRHYNVNKKDKEGDQQLVFSMDDQAIYGKVVHHLSFRSAVQKKLICDYKIIISIVDSETINRELLKQGEVIVEGDIIKAQRIANILALQSAVENYSIKRIFSFHNSVQSAKSFTATTNEGIGAYLKDFSTLHVNGGMSTSRRETILKEFEESEKAIISNARCLTEGVNVPAVDMVAFISPKKSKVDIIQAAGRAMRITEGKSLGYILIPLFMQKAENETIEEALEKTQFDTVWDVLQAMKEQDESLAEIIGQMKEELGRSLGFNDNRLREEIEILGPKLCVEKLRKSIASMIVERLGSSWNERFGELVKFKEIYGHCNISGDNFEYKHLIRWTTKQRTKHKSGKLDQIRVNKLNNIGFEWNPINNKWDRMFDKLCKFYQINGHCSVSKDDSKYFALGSWVTFQRVQHKKGKLSQERIVKLEKLGFDWNPIDVLWENNFLELCKFKEKFGHCNVPKDYSDNPSLGIWVDSQRQKKKKGILPHYYLLKLTSIDFDWSANDTRWEKKFVLLCKFKDEMNHCDVPSTYEDKQLASWVTRQRTLYGQSSLIKDRLNKLIDIGFVFEPDKTVWEEMFAELNNFKIVEGHCNVPQKYAKSPELGRWVTTQRAKYRKGDLSQIRLDKLSNLNFNWAINPTNREIASWDENFLQLSNYYKKHGHCTVPSKNKILNSWVNKQRTNYRNNNLSEECINKLNTLTFVWNPTDKHAQNWNYNFEHLVEYKKRHGHCNVPISPKNKALGSWVSKQRTKYRNNNLSEELINKLNTLNLDWNPANKQTENWNNNFYQLVTYKDLHGHCNVPKNYTKNQQLATWVDKQRQKYRKNELHQENINKLTILGFDWSPRESDWEIMFSRLLEFKSNTGHCNVVRNNTHKKLANWVNNQRNFYRNKNLDQKRINLLSGVGFIFEPDKDDWENMFSALCHYKAKNGNCKVPQKYAENQSLGRWVARQRSYYNNKALSEEKLKKLNSIGFVWPSVKINRGKFVLWEDRFLQLCKFKELHGHCNVPKNYSENQQLERWVRKQREDYKKGSLLQKKVDQLNNIGFAWKGKEKITDKNAIKSFLR